MATAQERSEALFKRLDTEGNGRLSQTDIDVLVIGWCEATGLRPGDDKWRAVVSAGNAFWQALSDQASADMVSKDEFAKALASPGFVDQVVIPFHRAAMDAADRNGDGTLSVTEWMNWQTRFGLSQLEALDEFQSADGDGDGYLTKEEYTQQLKTAYAP